MSKHKFASTPLRNLIVTVMLGRDPETELMTDDEIESDRENCARSPDRARWPGELAEIQSADVTPHMETGDEHDSYQVSYLFVRGDECVILDISNPSYCDDESDGYLTSASEVMTLDQARKTINDAVEEYRRSVEAHIQSRGQYFAKLMEGFVADRAEVMA